MSDVSLIRRNYVLTHAGVNLLRKYLTPFQQEVLLQVLQILDVDASEFCQKYSLSLNIPINNLQALCTKLNGGQFECLNDFPLITANSECLLDLIALYGLEVIPYAANQSWENQRFIAAIINNHATYYAITHRKFMPAAQRADSEITLPYLINRITVNLIDDELAQLILAALEDQWLQLTQTEISSLLQHLFAAPAKEYIIDYLITRNFIENDFERQRQTALGKQLMIELAKRFETLELVAQLLNHHRWVVFELIPRKWWHDADLVSKLLDLLFNMQQQDFSIPYMWLSFITKSIKHDLLLNIEIAKKLLVLHPKLREFLPPKLLVERDLLKWLISYDYTAAEYLDISNLPREELIALVAKNGLVLQYANSVDRQDREVVKTAISQNPLAFEFADIMLRDDEEFALDAILLHSANYTHISGRLKNSYEIAYQAVAHNSFAVQLLNRNFRQDPKIRQMILQNELLK